MSLCFLKTGLSQTLSSLQSNQMELDAKGTHRWPRGEALQSSPLLTPELGLWLGKITHPLPLACCGGHFPPNTTPLIYPFPPAVDSAQMPVCPTWA